MNVVAGAGNETTTRLIGWAGKVLADHPDQRRELVEDRSLIPNAIEELLRYEPPAPHVARYVARDVERYGETVPEGSVMLLLIGAANRDDRRYPEADRFDIHRDVGQPLTFGYGIHFCLGAALARLEGRVALDEVLHAVPRVGRRPRPTPGCRPPRRCGAGRPCRSSFPSTHGRRPSRMASTSRPISPVMACVACVGVEAPDGDQPLVGVDAPQRVEQRRRHLALGAGPALASTARPRPRALGAAARRRPRTWGRSWCAASVANDDR